MTETKDSERSIQVCRESERAEENELVREKERGIGENYKSWHSVCYIVSLSVNARPEEVSVGI